MKKISILFVLLVACIASAVAGETAINRMVLKAVKDFNEINVSGDVTVELRYNPKWAGYIVYHYDKNVAKNIKCYNDENVLFVTGTSDGIMSRLVIFHGTPLKSIIYNGNARLVSRKIICNPDEFKIIVNGSGDVKIGYVKTKDSNFVINNSGNLYIKNLKIENVNAVINGTGQLVMKENPQSLNVVKNGNGNVQSGNYNY